MKKGLLTVFVTLMMLMPPAAPRAQQAAVASVPPSSVTLRPTAHPRVSSDLSQLWMAPTGRARSQSARSVARNDVASAARMLDDSKYAAALTLVSAPGMQQGDLGPYAAYYRGVAELGLERAADARATFRALLKSEPVGYLTEAAALREAESLEVQHDPHGAMEIYERLAKSKTIAPDDVLMRLGHAAGAAGEVETATQAFSRVVYEFPFSDRASDASAELGKLPIRPIAAGTNRYKLEIGRAERLFGAKRYAAARTAFDGVHAVAEGDDTELVTLRLAECDYFLKRAKAARDAVKPYLEHASRQGEALFFHAVASRDLGDLPEYFRTVRRLADDFATQSWAEEALNSLATYYIVQNDDEHADEAFREMFQKFPSGHYAERAAWKIGWRAYRAGRYADTVRAFETGAANFPRSDYRPAWLYWSARAYDGLKQPDAAEARYRLVTTDYLNLYYGRLAEKILAGRNVRIPERTLIVEPNGGAAASPLPPNAAIVRALLAVELYPEAIDELHYAQRVWGDSPAIQATLGWIFNQQGDLRAGINAVKRAYPQYMASGGEKLPTDVLKVLFPVNYWTLIRKYSAEHQLDPYLIAALIAQESNFEADVKSVANAYGLMQLLPSTGRQYARTLRISSRFSLGLLTTAEPNVRMGTAYFSDLVKRFGGVHYALATYNAGPSRVARWIAERPGVERDEFIDDIPFPETQNYVKRILGTAEDYRRLYGPGSGSADADDVRPAVSRASTPPAAKKVSAAPAKKKAAAKAKAPAKKKTASKSKKAA